MPAERHEIAWDATDRDGRHVSAGLYLVRVEVGAFRETRRIVLLP
jgi:hypothetical protein